jgi:hypothetical protein
MSLRSVTTATDQQQLKVVMAAVTDTIGECGHLLASAIAAGQEKQGGGRS